ncbi:hypothetical protein ACFLEY_07250 [Bradyrhizobium sp. YCK136]|uniref:hypothetical protein n=1 Tax=Bradyrhizobium sp. YCK136 TaxID=3351346 RepID=UPI0037C64DF2
MGTLFISHSRRNNAEAIIQDVGGNVVVLAYDGGIALLDITSGTILSRLGIEKSQTAVSPHFAFIADESGRIVTRSATPTGIKSISSLLFGQPATRELSVGISRSGTWAIAGDGKNVRVWAL